MACIGVIKQNGDRYMVREATLADYDAVLAINEIYDGLDYIPALYR